MDGENRKFTIVKLVSWLLYGVALFVFGLGMLGGVSVANAAAAIPAATFGFQSPALKPLWDQLVTWLNIAGALVAGVSFVLGLTLAAVGLLLTRAYRLDCRVRQLEASSAATAAGDIS